MKVANSYASLLRGVSQQVPQERAEGQHDEQVNMLSDPVNGLTRRRGSVFLAERELAASGYQAAVADTRTWTSLDFDTGGKEYTILMRRTAKVASSPLPGLICYNKTDKAFLPLTGESFPGIINLFNKGVAAATAVGKYIFMAANNTAAGSYSVGTTPYKNSGVIWVRGGAYARTFVVRLRMESGLVLTVSHTTPTASYQGVLTTTDIPQNATDYTKQVNDRVNAYNNEVTKWIGTSAAATQPAAIATALSSAILLAGKPCGIVGSTIVFEGGDTPATRVVSVEVDDGGDGSLMYGVVDEVGDVAKLSTIHQVGKVVRVRANNANESYYMEAVPKSTGATGFTEVTWTEGTAFAQTIAANSLMYATIYNNTFCVADSAANLGVLVPGGHPTFNASTAGDEDSNPAPFWVGKQVSYLGTFQNRLVVGCGGVLSCSRTDDYLNFFRTTVLTLPADDAFEMLPTGSEDDVLRSSVLYDQDLVIFGNKRQYIVSGNTALTPTSANMRVMTSFEQSADAAPVSAGGFIFYAKRGESYSTVHQIQPGQTDNSPESFPASSQLDNYLAGSAVEMASLTGMPSMLFLRTTNTFTEFNADGENGLYVFSYLDKQDGRKMDSWSRWEFNKTACGAVSGLSVVPDGVILFFIRKAPDNKVFVVADFASVVTTLSDKPYLDSNRPYSALNSTGATRANSGSEWAVAFDTTSQRRFTGSLLPNAADLIAAYPGEPGLTLGALQTSLLVPTNPFMRDGKDNAIMSGRLTITKLILAYKDSIGLVHEVSYRGRVEETVTFNGRVMGDPLNVIGKEPISTGQYSIPIGRETRDYRLAILSRRWYPLTITAIEWVGQFFNRVQRF